MDFITPFTIIEQNNHLGIVECLSKHVRFYAVPVSMVQLASRFAIYVILHGFLRSIVLS